METIGGGVETPATDRVGRVLAGLGPKLRHERRVRGITLEVLAAEIGTSAAHLSRLESGERQPSLDGLLKLALGLGVPMSELLEEPEGPAPGTVVRGSDTPFREGRGFRVQSLVPEAGPEGLSAIKVVYPADRVADPKLYEHDGQEWIYMIKGKHRLTLGSDRTILEPGDAAFFDARLPHNFDVLSEEDAEVLMVSCVPCTHRRQDSGYPHSFIENHQEYLGSDADG